MDAEALMNKVVDTHQKIHFTNYTGKQSKSS